MVLGLLVHVTPSNFFSRIRKSESFTNHIFSEQLFYGNYSKLDSQYKHCNFSRICLLVKMASKTVTRSIRSHFEITVPNIFNVFYFFRRNYINHQKRKSKESGYGPPKFAGRKSILNLRYARTSSRFSIINNKTRAENRWSRSRKRPFLHFFACGNFICNSREF